MTQKKSFFHQAYEEWRNGDGKELGRSAWFIESICIDPKYKELIDDPFADVVKKIEECPDILNHILWNIIEATEYKDFKVYTYLLKKREEYEKSLKLP